MKLYEIPDEPFLVDTFEEWYDRLQDILTEEEQKELDKGILIVANKIIEMKGEK